MFDSKKFSFKDKDYIVLKSNSSKNSNNIFKVNIRDVCKIIFQRIVLKCSFLHSSPEYILFGIIGQYFNS